MSRQVRFAISILLLPYSYHKILVSSLPLILPLALYLIANSQNICSPILKSSQENIIRFHDGYTWPQHLDYLSSNVPSLWSSGSAAKHIVNGYTAAIPDGVLPHVAADPNVWGISDSGYIYVAGDKFSANTFAPQQDTLAGSATEDKDPSSEDNRPRWVGKQFVIGLRNTGHVEKHLASLPAMLREQVEQHIPEINGYAIPTFVGSRMLDLIRKDPSVGFIVTKPRGFFSANGAKDLKGDEKEDYELERMWLTLQSSDPKVETTDDGDESVLRFFTFSIFHNSIFNYLASILLYPSIIPFIC